MSSWHYYIKSKSRIRITDKKDNKKYVSIDNVVSVKENERMIIDNEFNQGKSHYILNSLFLVTIIITGLLFILLVIGNDFLNLEDNVYMLINDMVAFTSVIIVLASIESFRFNLNKYLKFGTFGNKLYISICFLLISLLGGFLLYKLNISGRLANTFSLMCFAISCKNYFHSS